MTPGPVLFDLQTLQSPALRQRAVARYAYELAVALEQGHPQLVGRYLLNPDLPAPGDLEPLVSAGKVGHMDPSDQVAAEARVLHVISPFDPAVAVSRIWPRWAHARGLHLCATAYDPVPTHRAGESLHDLRERTRRSAGLEVLRAADALLTTSAATSRSLEENLHVDAAKLYCVGSGAERLLVPPQSKENALLLAQASVPGLEPSFVLCPTVGERSDNVEALIAGFARLPAQLRGSRQLVVCGHLPARVADRLRDVADDEGIEGRVLLSGTVPTEVMLRLYQAADLVCFQSLSREDTPAVGQAMACGAVAIAADVGVAREHFSPVARFDPASPAAISACIERGLCDERFREVARQSVSFTNTTWAEAADRTAAVYEKLLTRPRHPWRRRRRRLAIVSPFPPVVSGVANYSFRLVEELATVSGLDVDCFADGLEFSPGPPSAPAGLAVYDARHFPVVEAATAGYDDIVYVLGNSEFHTTALALLRHRRGTVLAHDVRLSGLYRFAGGPGAAAFPEGGNEEPPRTYGPFLPEVPALSHETVTTGAHVHDPLMAREVIGLADRFLVTSRAAARLARDEAGPRLASRVMVVDFATEALRAVADSDTAHAPIEPGVRVLASFGIVDPVKQPHKLLRSFASLAASRPDLVLALVGPVSAELASSLGGLGEALGLGGRLFVTGRVVAGVYLDWMRRAELAVQLRASFSGEASAAVGDCLACGVPMVVTDIGWMGDLPDDVALKVPVDVTSLDLAESCASLLDDPAARGALSMRARSYASAHSFKVAARSLLEALVEAPAVAG
ncbi:MAG: glycosyltransferase [Acidimicrobiales bacterium]